MHRTPRSKWPANGTIPIPDAGRYPLEWISRAKFFPYVSKIDNGYGDRNLVCTCCEF